tara:strand:+ start:247 stop:1506 length:1260 start_codon:yes stop_codon:yes gene_type:complete
MRHNSLTLSFFFIFVISTICSQNLNYTPTKLIPAHCGKVYSAWIGTPAMMTIETPPNPNPGFLHFPRYQIKVLNTTGNPQYMNVRGGFNGTISSICQVQNFANLLCNTTYNVVVRWRPFISSPFDWGPWGDTCLITTPDCDPQMLVKVKNPFCGSVISDWYQEIPLTAKSYKWKYKVKINNIPGDPFYEDSVESIQTGNVSNKFSLDQFQNTPSGSLSPNTTYEVRATWKARHFTGMPPFISPVIGDWRPYGDICYLTTPEPIPDLVVLGSAGTVFDSASPWFINYSISYTVGEAVIHDVINTSNNDMLTQGFQQPSEIIVVTPGSGQADMPTHEPLFTVYPNPTNAIATLIPNNEIDYVVNVACFDANGSLLWEQKMENNRLLIDLQNNTSGIYHLKIFNDNNQLLDSKKLIKVVSQP